MYGTRGRTMRLSDNSDDDDSSASKNNQHHVCSNMLGQAHTALRGLPALQQATLHHHHHHHCMASRSQRWLAAASHIGVCHTRSQLPCRTLEGALPPPPPPFRCT